MAQNRLSKYTVEIYDPDGNLLADLSGIANARKLQRIRNRAGSCVFTVDLNTLEDLCRRKHVNPADLLAVNHNEVKLRKGTTYLFGGQINYVEGSLSETQTLEVRAVGFLDLFADRHVLIPVQFSSEDAGDIAWQLIDTAQTDLYGDFGVLQGTIQTSVNRDRSYEKYQNIKELIIQLSEVINGFDFEINYDKEFNVYYPYQGNVRPNILFEYPGNIKSISIPTDGSKMVNRALMRGQGFGESQLQVEREDTDYQEFYAIREKIYDNASVSLESTLENYGDAYVDEFRSLLQIPEIVVDGNKTPFITDYGIGDRIPITINGYEIYSHINKTYYRIDAIDLSVDDNDQEDIRLTLSLP